MEKFGPVGTRPGTYFDELGGVGIGFFLLARQLGGVCRPSEAIKAVRIELQVSLVLAQGFLRTVQLDQQVGQHFAGGECQGLVTFTFLLLGDLAKDGDSFVVPPLGMRQPGCDLLSILLDKLGGHGFLFVHQVPVNGI